MRDTIIYNQLCKNLGNPPTDDQSDALKKIASYICDNNNDVIFLMTGYAGTGKTSVISSCRQNPRYASDAFGSDGTNRKSS